MAERFYFADRYQRSGTLCRHAQRVQSIHEPNHRRRPPALFQIAPVITSKIVRIGPGVIRAFITLPNKKSLLADPVLRSLILIHPYESTRKSAVCRKDCPGIACNFFAALFTSSVKSCCASRLPGSGDSPTVTLTCLQYKCRMVRYWDSQTPAGAIRLEHPTKAGWQGISSYRVRWTQ